MIRVALQTEAYKLTAGNRWFFKPETLDTYPKELTVSAVRNSFAAFQILVCSDEDWVLNLAPNPRYSQRAELPVISVRAEGKLPLTLAIEDMHHADDRKLWADALLSTPAVEESRQEPRAIWAEMAIPADAEPGEYAVTVTVAVSSRTEDETLVASLPVTVKVLPYVLPDGRDFRCHLDLWQHNTAIAKLHEVELWSDAHFAVLEKYVKTLGELGQKCVTLVVSEAPWSGQGCTNEHTQSANLFEYSIIPVTRRADGTFVYDYTKMQRYIDLCAEAGIQGELSLYGLANVWGEGTLPAPVKDYPDGIRIRYYDEADHLYKYMREAAQLDDYIRALEAYFVETNQIDRVRLAADEPGDIEKYRRALTHLREIAPRFRFKAAINHAEFIAEFGEEVDDYVPYINGLCQEYDRLMEYKATLKGKRFLWYVCCGPNHPNTFLGSQLVESYFLGVLTAYAKMDGFLRWSYSCYNDDPRTDPGYGGWRTGDILFVYPAANGEPLLTIRYKAFRRGMELCEMLYQLEERDPAAAEEAYALVVREKDIRNYYKTARSLESMCSTEYGDYQKLVEFLAEKLG